MAIRDNGDELKWAVFFKGGYGMKEFRKNNLKPITLTTLVDQTRRRTRAAIANGGKAANDEAVNAWRAAA